jgi:hypothetical protein
VFKLKGAKTPENRENKGKNRDFERSKSVQIWLSKDLNSFPEESIPGKVMISGLFAALLQLFGVFNQLP